jgi:hypothetical protein
MLYTVLGLGQDRSLERWSRQAGHNRITFVPTRPGSVCVHLTPLDRAPLVYPNPPLPIPDVFLELATLLDVVSAPYADDEDDAVAPPLVKPLTLPLETPRAIPLEDDGAVPAALFRSSSSAFLRASSRRRSASAARLSASCCFCSASFSMSTRSCVAPFHSGLSSSRWLCSVCDRMRVHVLRRVEALSTVLETVCT